MSRLFIFSVGGSGSRVLRSLNMLLAAGVPQFKTGDEIVPIMIDYDTKNGDTDRAFKCIETYAKLRDSLYPPHTANTMVQNNPNNFFHTAIRNINQVANNEENQDRFTLEFRASANDKTFGDAIGYENLTSDKAKTRDLLKTLYDVDPQSGDTEMGINMEVGFKGNPNIGSVVFRRLRHTSEFKDFVPNCTDGDKVVIIGSLFGGTGSSGIPELVSAIRAAKGNNVEIGVIMILPYFCFDSDKEKKKENTVKGSLFNSKTRAALKYYESSKTNGLIDYIYYVGDKERTKIKNYSLGGKDQQNNSHIVDLIAAIDILNFNTRGQATKKGNKLKYQIIGNTKDQTTGFNIKNFMDDNKEVTDALLDLAFSIKYVDSCVAHPDKELARSAFNETLKVTELYKGGIIDMPKPDKLELVADSDAERVKKDKNRHNLQVTMYYFQEFSKQFKEWVEELKLTGVHNLQLFNFNEPLEHLVQDCPIIIEKTETSFFGKKTTSESALINADMITEKIQLRYHDNYATNKVEGGEARIGNGADGYVVMDCLYWGVNKVLKEDKIAKCFVRHDEKVPAPVVFSIEDEVIVNINNVEGSYIIRDDANIDTTKISERCEISSQALNKMTTSIPTPFARVYLFDGAFDTLNAIEQSGSNNENRGKAFSGKNGLSINHYAVADVLDMLEFLFEYGYDPHLVIEEWNPSDLRLLDSKIAYDELPATVSIQEKHQLLHDAIDGALSVNTNNVGVLDKTIYIFKWRVQNNDATYEYVIGGTSPLTLVYTAPNWRKNKPQPFHGGRGNELFPAELDANVKPVPLSERSKLFRQYLYKLCENYTQNNDNPFFRYVELTQLNYEPYNSPLQRGVITPTHIDQMEIFANMRNVETGSDIKVGANIPIKVRNKGAKDPDSCYYIVPTVKNVPAEDLNGQPVDLNVNRPLVLSANDVQGVKEPHYWYDSTLGKMNPVLAMPSDQPYYHRELPNVPGVKYPNLRVEDFLEDRLVRLSYDLDNEHFITACAGNCKFLLPLKPTFLRFFRVEDIKTMLKIDVTEGGNAVLVTLNIPVGKYPVKDAAGKETIENRGIVTFTKKYSTADRTIVANAEFNISLFPFYRLTGTAEQYNCYEVMLGHDGKTTLSFHKDDTSEVAPKKVKNRTVDFMNMNTTYYHLGDEIKTNNMGTPGTFAFVQAKFDNGACGLVVPAWKDAELSDNGRPYIFCIDFGTANTHVAYAQLQSVNGPVDAKTIATLTYDKYDQMVSLKKTRNGDAFDILNMREFVPDTIKEGADVEFPVRSIIFQKEKSGGEIFTELFSEMNIAFNLNEEKEITGGEPKSDLKWNNDTMAKNRMKAFFTELIWIIKNKVVALGGDMNFRLFFTFPQSMTLHEQDIMTREWLNARRAVRAGMGTSNNPSNVITWNNGVLGVDSKPLTPYEGVAPYYRFRSQQQEMNSSFMNIDIGGGTFDVIIVDPNTTNIANTARIVDALTFSARFAANDLWGHGVNDNVTNKINGFLNYYLSTDQGQHYEKSNTGFCNYRAKADSPSDTIAYLFKHDEDARFSETINANSNLKTLIALHYASIIYYIGRVLLLNEHECPSFVRFTGMGSKYISIITSNNKVLTDLTKAILNYATGGAIDIPNDFTVEYNGNYHPKMVTAEGGLLMWNTLIKNSGTDIVDISNGSMVYGFEDENTGVETKTESEVLKPEYKEPLMKRIEHMLGMFNNAEIRSLLNSVNVTQLSRISYNNIKDVLDKSYENCATEYRRKANSEVESTEAIFFWPLKAAIHSLALK